MEIKRIEAIPVAAPIRAFRDSHASYNYVNFVLVTVEDGEGNIGCGEASAFSPQFYGETIESIVSSIKRYLGPAIIGENPLNIGRIVALMDRALHGCVCAKTGLDLALYDLAGKILHVPVAFILGGLHRNRVLAASEVAIDEPEVMAERALELLKMGFKVIKLKVGAGFEDDVKRIRAVWDAIGDKATLRIDPNAGWTRYETVRLFKCLPELEIEYLEQPIEGWDLDGMAEIKRATGATLMADESVWAPQDVASIALKNAADIVNIKITKAGGLYKSVKINTVAETFGLPCIVGTELEPSVGIPAKLHFAASLKRLMFACEFTELVFLRDNLLKNRIKLENGYLGVPLGVGFGVEPDMKKIDAYRIDI